jgi:glycosyltransferase involved in cell wall biosynthesis
VTGCVQGSRLRSTVAAAEAYLHDVRAAYRAVRLWIAPSRFVAEEASAWGVPAAALRVLAHGVQPPPAPPPAPAAAAAPHVLYAGRLSVEKGVRLLPALAARLRPTPLRVVGEGPLAEWLDRAGVPNLERLGRLDDAALAAQRAAAVVVVPSLFVEHFGYALAEALLDARPVVASRIGALPELVEHEVTGLLAPPGDAEALADAVRRALADPAARGWGEAGRERVRAIGDPSRHLEGLLAVYREAVAARA